MPSVEPPALSWLHTCGPLPFQILVNAVRLTGAECSSKRTHESEKVVNYVKFIRDPVKSIRSMFLPLNSSVIFLPLNSSGTLSGHAGPFLNTKGTQRRTKIVRSGAGTRYSTVWTCPVPDTLEFFVKHSRSASKSFSLVSDAEGSYQPPPPSGSPSQSLTFARQTSHITS
jgi:hypothetical protein